MHSIKLWLPAVTLGLALSSGAHAAQKAVPESSEFVKRIVDGAKIATDDVVLIRTNDELLPLAQKVVEEVARRGAVPTLEFASRGVHQAILRAAPEDRLSRPSTHATTQLRLLNAIIDLGPPNDPTFDQGVDTARLIRAAPAREELNKSYFATSIRRVVVGGPSFPTKSAAKFYGIRQSDWERAFSAAVRAKTSPLLARAAKVEAVLAGLKVVKITAANGTDLELRLAARPIWQNVGEMLPAVEKREGPREVRLPAGEVLTVPTEFFATGKLIAASVEAGGVRVQGLELAFKEGKATAIGAKKNFDTFRRVFGAAGGDKGIIGSLTIGVNQKSKPVNGYLSPEMDGVVTIGIGFNKPEGGYNESSFRARIRLKNATVEVDGKPLVVKGKLQLK